MQTVCSHKVMSSLWHSVCVPVARKLCWGNTSNCQSHHQNSSPLNSAQDRLPWLAALSEVLRKWEASGVGERRLQQDREVSSSPAANVRGVLACSALKMEYRKILASGLEGSKTGCVFVVLTGAKAVIAERMRRREHFFPSGLLQSQLDALELPTAEEGTGVGVVHADISQEVNAIVDDVLTQLNNICITCS